MKLFFSILTDPKYRVPHIHFYPNIAVIIIVGLFSMLILHNSCNEKKRNKEKRSKEILKSKGHRDKGKRQEKEKERHQQVKQERKQVK